MCDTNCVYADVMLVYHIRCTHLKNWVERYVVSCTQSLQPCIISARCHVSIYYSQDYYVLNPRWKC